MCSSKTITAFLMSGFLLFSGGSLISSGILSPAAVSAAEGDYELNDYVLFDEDTCSMTINDITIDNDWGVMLNVTCENKTEDHVQMFTLGNASVDTYLIDPFWADEVEAGASHESSIAFSIEEMESYGITSADEICFDLTVFDSNDFSAEPFYADSFTIYPTGLSEGDVFIPEYVPAEDAQALVQDDRLSFIYEYSEKDDFWGYALYVYLDNRTDLTLKYALSEVKVNGVDCDPFWQTVVAPDRRGRVRIAFFALEDLGVTGDVTDVSFRLTVSDNNDWEAEPLMDESFEIQP